MSAVIGALRAEFDRHGFGALVEIERGDVLRVVETSEQATFAQARQDPVGQSGKRIDLADHLRLAGPQGRAQVRVERHTAPGLAHLRHQLERQCASGIGQCWWNAGGV